MKKKTVNFPVYDVYNKIGAYRKLVIVDKTDVPKNISEKFDKEIRKNYEECRKYIQNEYGIFPIWENIDYYILPEKSYDKYEGKSVGLAAFVGFFAFILNLDIPQNYFFSAEIKNNELKYVTKINEKYQAIKNDYSNDFNFYISKEHQSDFGKNKNVLCFKTVKEVINNVFDKQEILKKIKSFIKNINIDSSLETVNLQFKKHQFSIAENNYKNILHILKSKKQQTNHIKENLLLVNTRLGIIYTHYGKLRELKKHFNKAKRIIDNDKENLLDGKYIVEYLNVKSVGLFDYYLFDEAYKTVKKAIKLAKDYRISVREKGKIFGSCGHIYLQKKDFENAEVMYKKAIELVQNDEKSKDYVFLGNVYVKQNRIKEAKRALKNANKYLSYIEDIEKKNIQMIYNKLLQLKIYDMTGVSLNTANKVYNEIKNLSAQIKQTAGLLYPNGVAGYYLAKIHFNKNDILKSEKIITDSYQYLESLKSANIDVIAACIRLFKMFIILNKSGTTDKSEIKNQFEKVKRSIYKISTIKNHYISNLKDLEFLLTESSFNKKNIINKILEIIEFEPYL